MSTIRTSDDHVPGIRTFRIQSDGDPSTWYTVKRVRRPPSVKGPVIRNRWICTCGDYINRRMLENTHCKHIKRIREYARHLGGVSLIPRGQTLVISSVLPPKLKMPRKP